MRTTKSLSPAVKIMNWKFPRRDGQTLRMKSNANTTNRWQIAYQEQLDRIAAPMRMRSYEAEELEGPDPPCEDTIRLRVRKGMAGMRIVTPTNSSGRSSQPLDSQTPPGSLGSPDLPNSYATPGTRQSASPGPSFIGDRK
jgi:hypothetical protein